MVLHEQVYGKGPVQSELRGAQNPSSRFQALWRPASYHLKATKLHLAQVPQQLTVGSSQAGARKVALEHV